MTPRPILLGREGKWYVPLGFLASRRESFSAVAALPLSMSGDSASVATTGTGPTGSFFAGLREQALARDGHRCRGCQGPAVDSVLSVHHRQPGRSSLDLLITLCPACHALIERTQVLYRDVPELLRVLWRELHPAGSEQLTLFGP